MATGASRAVRTSRACWMRSATPWGRLTLPPACRKTHGRRWRTWLAHDFGSSAPSVTFLMCESPGGKIAEKFYPRGSIIVLDELAAYRPDSLNTGLGWTATVTAEAIRSELTDKWKVPSWGVADDACFAKSGHGSGSIAEEFARGGVTFFPARKADRISGWQRLRRLLADAGKPDRPGLYISRSCEYTWATVPFLPRDQRRVEDVDSSGCDHAADALRYGCLYQAPVLGMVPMSWVGSG